MNKLKFETEMIGIHHDQFFLIKGNNDIWQVGWYSQTDDSNHPTGWNRWKWSFDILEALSFFGEFFKHWNSQHINIVNIKFLFDLHMLRRLLIGKYYRFLKIKINTYLSHINVKNSVVFYTTCVVSCREFWSFLFFCL